MGSGCLLSLRTTFSLYGLMFCWGIPTVLTAGVIIKLEFFTITVLNFALSSFYKSVAFPISKFCKKSLRLNNLKSPWDRPGPFVVYKDPVQCWLRSLCEKDQVRQQQMYLPHFEYVPRFGMGLRRGL